MEETNGGSVRRRWNSKSKNWEIVNHKQKTFLEKFILDAFLPANFPESVTSDYVSYQIYDSLQAFCSTVTGMLATRATFKRAGVGNITATATNATLTWILQDGASMVGRILFAWGFSEQLDNDAKMWRFAADIFNDLGMAIEIASPFAPSYMFVWLACIATLLKALCGVTGGATRASLSQHFAKTDNMADLAAKDGSQETVINLVGMIFSAFVVQFIPESNFAVTYSVFTIFTILHLLTNWMAVRSVVLHSLNTQRTDALSRKFILAKSKVLSPVQISNEEHIFWLNSSRITLGVPISGFPINEDLWKKILDVEMIPRYIISVKSLPSQKNQISIALIEGASALDILQAYFHGVLLQESNSITDTVVTANHDSVSHFNDFINGLEANGWDIGLENEHNRINIGPWRYSLGIKSHAE